MHARAALELRMGNNHSYRRTPASVENATGENKKIMEDSFTKLISSQREIENGDTNAPKGTGPDDLTNLNWVAGIPVPMDASVSPPEGCRAKKLFYGSPSTKNLTGHNQAESSSPTTPNFVVPARTKSLKTPLPTYKIVLKDQTPDTLSHTRSTNNLSPEKRDSVILANIVSSENDYFACPEVELGKPALDEEDCMVVVEKEGGALMEEASTEDMETLQLHHDKPNCSYTCLIGMALKASSGCLPVNAIYQYIEKEFPYFITAPDGWKNSVRHNLSLNPIFRKVNREGWTGKKGYLWEVCPDKQDLVDKEILRFLHVTGKKLGEFTAPVKVSSKYKQRPKKNGRSPQQSNTTPIFCSRCTRIVSPTPQESSTSSDDSCAHMATVEEIKKYSTEVQKEIASSDLSVKPKAMATQPALDTNKSPSKYIGVKSPTTDPTEVAREVFGLCSSPDNPNPFYPMNYGGPFIPLYTQPGQFGMPYENFEPVMSNSSSSSSSASPLGPTNAAMFSHYHQYAMPMPFHYILGGQYPPMYGAPPNGICSSHSREDTTQKATSPLSVKVLSSSNHVENVESSHTLDSQPPGDGRHKGSTKRNKRQNSSDFLWTSPNVAGLTSPLKRMKVIDDSLRLDRSVDDSISAYFADVSANSTCSDDDDANENEEVSSIMSLLLKSNQQQETRLPLAGLNHISPKQKETLEQIAGTSDLGTLLSDGLESYISKEKTSPNQNHNIGHSPPNGYGTGNFAYVSSMDMHDIDTNVASSQGDSYYLPSLDTLLNIGEDTIVTLKAAMNLDIQGVVEIATEEEIRSSSNTALNTVSTDGIQIN